MLSMEKEEQEQEEAAEKKEEVEAAGDNVVDFADRFGRLVSLLRLICDLCFYRLVFLALA